MKAIFVRHLVFVFVILTLAACGNGSMPVTGSDKEISIVVEGKIVPLAQRDNCSVEANTPIALSLQAPDGFPIHYKVQWSADDGVIISHEASMNTTINIPTSLKKVNISAVIEDTDSHQKWEPSAVCKVENMTSEETSVPTTATPQLATQPPICCNETATPNAALLPSPTSSTSASQLPTCDSNSYVELLPAPWSYKGTAGNSVEPPKPYLQIKKNDFTGKDAVRIIIDLHGKSYGVGERYDESAIILEQQGKWFVISVSSYKDELGKDINGTDGKHTFIVPLTDFIGLIKDGIPDGSHLTSNQPIGPVHFRFWNADNFSVDIDSIAACKLSK